MSTPDDDSITRRVVAKVPREEAPTEMYMARHTILEEIGSGGMGTVHRASDARLGREVADTNGTVAFTMKLVRGESLHEWLHGSGRLIGSPEMLGDGLEIFTKVCDAISFAHSHGVIHRDLKPANVMVGEFGEVYLMDWGLATHVRPNVGGVPRMGAPLGTPGYLSPELARGAIDEQDERTDVFGLGALLYEIVTGKPPYPKSFELPDREAELGAYTPPEQALGSIRVAAGLLRIIKKALSRERDDRYSSAAALKLDVKAVLRGGLHLPTVRFAAGTSIVVEGELGEAAYVVVSGECIAYRTIDGERVILRRFGPGDVFGEISVLSNHPRVATVEAVNDVTALVLTQKIVDEELDPDTWLGTLVRALSKRFRELDGQANR